MKSLMTMVMAMLVGMFMLVIVAEGRAPVLHRVGGSKFGWRLNVNFSNWAAHEHFYVGDWLYFGFDRQKFSVLEVNQTGYKQCVERNFITNITRGGRDVFNLTVARPYYFISGRGYCLRGVKLVINVHVAPPDNSLLKTTPINSHATITTTTMFFFPFVITIIIVLVWTFVFI